MAFYEQIKETEQTIPLFKTTVSTVIIIGLGLIIGVLSKVLDIYTTNLGNVFSQTSVWIFLGTLISVYSNTALRAAINVFGFCMGMLLTYYITAELTASIYSHSIAFGWILFGLFSPLIGLCAWYANGKNWVSKIVSFGILAGMLMAAIVLFDRIRISDILFAVLTGIVLFKKESFEKVRESGGV